MRLLRCPKGPTIKAMKLLALSKLALLLALPLAISAQTLDVSLSFGRADANDRQTGQIGVTDPTSGVSAAPITMGSGFLFAPRLTMHTRKHLSHEFSYVFSRANLKVGENGSLVNQGMSVGQLMYNALLSATPEGSKIRPYVTGGAGLVSFYPPGYGIFSGVTVNRPGVNYGAGVRMQLTEMFHGRVDFRQVLSPGPKLYQGQVNNSHFRQNQFSAGVGITF